MKDQALSGADLADRVERLTGDRPSPVWVSRRLLGVRPLIRVSEDLFVIAAALELDPMDLVEDAVRGPAPANNGSASPTFRKVSDR
jgi:hypothetical protein